MDNKLPVFSKQTTKEKIITILYFISIIVTLVLVGVSYSGIIKDYIWLFSMSLCFIIMGLRNKKYNIKTYKRSLLIAFIGILLGIIDLFVL